MTFTQDEIATFRTCLSPYARRNYQSGMVAHSHLVKAIGLGWKPKELARHCSRDLPNSGAWAVIQSRLAWCSEHPPADAQAKPAKRETHDCHQHPDAHVCPWIDQPDGTVRRCDCTTIGVFN